MSRMSDKKRKQEEGDVAGTSITPRDAEKTRVGRLIVSRSRTATRPNNNGFREGSTYFLQPIALPIEAHLY